MKNTVFLSLLLCTICFSCSKKATVPVLSQQNMVDQIYLDDLESWKSERIAYLKKPLGYMSLAGLYWLDEEENSFGSSRDADLKFPSSFPGFMGKIVNKAGIMSVTITCEERVKFNDEYDDQAFVLADDSGHATMMNWRSYYWYLIKRGDKLGVRLKDTLSEARQNLVSIPSFEAQEAWVKTAKFIPSTNDEKIAITNHVGMTTESQLAGYVFFSHKGKGHFLAAVDAGENVFVVFGDQSNGDLTYGGGRFLYIPKPTEGTETVIDFNRAENPICAFNDFATCPLPPDGNKLPFAVLAGEKKIRD